MSKISRRSSLQNKSNLGIWWRKQDTKPGENMKKVKCYETNPALVHLTKYKHKLQLCTWESNDQYQYYYRIDTSNIRIVSAHINARISHIASTITWLNQFTLICRLYMTFTILWSVKYSNFEMVNAKKCACLLLQIVNLFALNVVWFLHTVSAKP